MEGGEPSNYEENPCTLTARGMVASPIEST
jgi:hypothetical protein